VLPPPPPAPPRAAVPPQAPQPAPAVSPAAASSTAAARGRGRQRSGGDGRREQCDTDLAHHDVYSSGSGTHPTSRPSSLNPCRRRGQTRDGQSLRLSKEGRKYSNYEWVSF